MTTNSAQSVMNAIESRGLTPKPRWHFGLRECLFWTDAVAITLLGGMAVGTTLYMLVDHDWNVFRQFDRSFIEDLLMSLPYLWLVLMVAFVVLARHEFCRTRYGYRNEYWKVIVVMSVASLSIGVVMFSFGFGSVVHNSMMQSVPFYESLTDTKEDIWAYPQKGLLGGRVMGSDAELVTVQDDDGNIWLVNFNGLHVDQRAFVPGTKLRIKGALQEPVHFDAEYVRLWVDE